MTVKFFDLVASERVGGGDWLERAMAACAAASPSDRPEAWLAYVVRDGRRPSDLSVISATWYRDSAHRSRALAAFAGSFEGATPIRVDERVVIGGEFVESVRSCASPVLLLFALLQRVPAQSRRGFADYWWDNHRVLAERDLPPEYPMLGYLHNYVADDDPSPWDGIGEIYEPSLDVARDRTRWITTPAGQALLEDEDRFLRKDTRRVYVTDQHVLIAPKGEL